MQLFIDDFVFQKGDTGEGEHEIVFNVKMCYPCSLFHL